MPDPVVTAPVADAPQTAPSPIVTSPDDSTIFVFGKPDNSIAPKDAPQPPAQTQQAPPANAPTAAAAAAEPPPEQLDAIRKAISGLPEDQVVGVLKAAGVSDAVIKTVRQTTISDRARQMVDEDPGVKALKAQVEVLSGQVNTMTNAERERKLLGMTASERELFELREQVEQSTNKTKAYETIEAAREEASIKAEYVDKVKNQFAEYGFTDEDAIRLLKVTDPEQFMFEALTIAREKIQVVASAKADAEARVQGHQRVESGASRFAASAPGSAGGEMSYAELQRAYLSDPGNPSIRDKFFAARRARPN